jgi:hypothetical protein
VSRRLLASAVTVLALLISDAATAEASELCTDRRFAMRMWIEALGYSFPSGHPGALVRIHCPPQRADLRVYLETIADIPARSTSLEGIDDGLFAAVREEWQKVPPNVELLTTYLVAAKDARRFTEIAALVDAKARLAVITALISAAKNKLSAKRIAWVRTTLAAIDDPAQLEAIAHDLFVLELSGQLPDDSYKDVLEKLRGRVPNAMSAARWTLIDQSNPVFDVAKLAAAGVDPAAVLAYARTYALTSCHGGQDEFLACARSIAKSDIPKLPALVATALKPEFEKHLRSIISSYSSKPELVNELAALGWDLDFVGDKLCEEAHGRPIEHRKPLLERAKQLTSAARCARSLEAELAADAEATARRRLLMTLLGVLGLIAPLLLGGALLVRWWRRPPFPLPGSTVAPAAGAAEVSRDARLETFLGRGLAAGIELARRDLAIGAIDPAVIERAGGVVKRAVATGAAASLLVRDGEAVAYIVALPVRTAQPQLVQRYLGAAWPEHVQEVQHLAGAPVTALVVLCAPEATEATLLVGRHDGARASDPDVLLGAREARERGTNSFHHVIPLSA